MSKSRGSLPLTEPSEKGDHGALFPLSIASDWSSSETLVNSGQILSSLKESHDLSPVHSQSPSQDEAAGQGHLAVDQFRSWLVSGAVQKQLFKGHSVLVMNVEVTSPQEPSVIKSYHGSYSEVH